VSVIAFGGEAERLLEFGKGDAIAVSGRARLTSWTSRDGVERHGLSITVEQIAAAKPRGAQSRSTPRAVHESGPPLPSDGLDDLFEGPAP
jgi:single-stranded DNA-binding protein